MTPTQRRIWRKRVFGHSELTASQKLVLLALETFADYPAGTNARPGVALLADTCGLGIRVVEGTLTRGRQLELIEQTGRANPKRGRAACYRLVSTRTDVQVEDASTRTSVQVEDAFQPAQTGFQPAQTDVSTRTLVQPTNPRTPIQNTEGARVDDEPRCPAHRDPHAFAHPPNCNACKQVRLQREGVAQTDAAREQAERQELARTRSQCKRCEGTGQIDVGTNAVARCPECSTPAARQRIIQNFAAAVGT